MLAESRERRCQISRRFDCTIARLVSKTSILREAESRQTDAVRGFRDFHFDDRRVRSGNLGRSQHGILRKYFAVNFRDKVIAAGFILPPHLPELNGFNGH